MSKSVVLPIEINPPQGPAPFANKPNPVPQYLTAEQVAERTGFSLKTLEAWRCRRKGPAYFHIGRSVRYRADQVQTWIEAEAVHCRQNVRSLVSAEA
jgi:excisionase family DNA binding protein